MQIPAMRALGNIVTGEYALEKNAKCNSISHVQTQGVIEAGVLPALAILLKNNKKCIKKEACWVVSNIAAGTPIQVGAIVQAEIIPPLVDCLAPRNDAEVRKEACWAICNCVSGGGPTQTGFKYSC